MIMGFFAIVVINVQQVAEQWGREIQVVAYFDRVPDKDKITDWRTILEGLEEGPADRFSCHATKPSGV